MASAAALLISVSDDGLFASLEVRPGPELNGDTADLEAALAKLTEAGVSYGIDAERVALALRQPGAAVRVAEGRPPVDGVDGVVTYTPDLLAVSGRPRVDDHGRVSLFDLGLVHNVSDGDILATIAKPTDGEPGMSVRGEVLPARPGRPARFRLGQGTRLSESGEYIEADVAGHVVLVGESIAVSQVFHVRGDVGPGTGHIDCVGSVRVSGNVDRGYRLRAAGDVEVEGSIDGGEVEAGGNVTVRYGILGRNGHGSVSSTGTLRAKFIEFATVKAGGNVYASDGIVNSSVEAGAVVEVLGMHGSIIGGRVAARELVKSRQLGSNRGVPTHVQVGADPALIADAQRVRARGVELARLLRVAQQRLAELQRAHRLGHLSGMGRHELVQLHQEYRVLLDERAALGPRQLELAEWLRGLSTATVVVSGTCHPGVRVSIGDVSYATSESWQGVQFHRNQQTHTVELTSVR